MVLLKAALISNSLAENSFSGFFNENFQYTYAAMVVNGTTS